MLGYSPEDLYPNFTDRVDTPVSRFVGRGVGLVSERVEAVVDAFSTIRCSGGDGVDRVVERTTVVIKSYRCSPVCMMVISDNPPFTSRPLGPTAWTSHEQVSESQYYQLHVTSTKHTRFRLCPTYDSNWMHKVEINPEYL